MPCNPQSAIAGLKPVMRPTLFGVRPARAALKVGSCAMGTREPRQVRKEAAVSGYLRVPQGRLAGVNYTGHARKSKSTPGAQPSIINHGSCKRCVSRTFYFILGSFIPMVCLVLRVCPISGIHPLSGTYMISGVCPASAFVFRGSFLQSGYYNVSETARILPYTGVL